VISQKKAVEKSSVGGWTNPRVDRLEELEPDLVIASDDLQDGSVKRVRKKPALRFYRSNLIL